MSDAMPSDPWRIEDPPPGSAVALMNLLREGRLIADYLAELEDQTANGLWRAIADLAPDDLRLVTYLTAFERWVDEGDQREARKVRWRPVKRLRRWWKVRRWR